MDPILLIQAVLNGLLIGSVYGLAALGLTLVWGIMDIVNMAHGEFILLGAYLTFVLFNLPGGVGGVSPLVAFLVALPAGALVGQVVFAGLLRRVLGRPGLTTLLLTFGLSIALNNILLNLFTPDVRSVRWAQGSLALGPFVLPTSRLIALGLVLLMSAVLFAFLQHTYTGKSIRAVMQDREAAAALGINLRGVLGVAFTIGTALAFLAGALLSIVIPFAPATALPYSITSFVICVVGGLGRPLGALLGGLIVGLVENFTGTFLSQAYTPATVSVLLIAFLLLRPAGLFGWTGR